MRLKKKFQCVITLLHALSVALISIKVWETFTLHTIKVCRGVPWKASISLRIWPFVDMSISFPSGLNFMPVQSQSLSWVNLNVVNGPYKSTSTCTYTHYVPRTPVSKVSSRLYLFTCCLNTYKTMHFTWLRHFSLKCRIAAMTKPGKMHCVIGI